MNIETYEDCIRQLENQIKSRQKQRQSMEVTIVDLDKQLQVVVQKNRKMREEIGYLANKNQSLVKDLHHLEQILHEKQRIISSSLAAEQGRRVYIESLQKEKLSLEQQLKRQDLVLSQQKIQLIDMQQELRRREQLVEGYKKEKAEKNEIIAEKQIKCQVMAEQVQQAKKQLKIAKQQYEKESQLMLKNAGESEAIVREMVLGLQKQAHSLQTQLQQTGQFHLNQLQVARFNHESQVGALLKQVSALQARVSAQFKEIAHLKGEEDKLKQHYDIQNQNNDQVVASLINQINFLKDEKTQIKKQNSIKLEETLQQILEMGLELAARENKVKAIELELRTAREQLSRKDHEVSNLRKEIQKLNLQIQLSTQQHSNEKNEMTRRNEEIAELKRYLQNLKQLSQNADKQKQLLSKKTDRAIDSLKHQIDEANLKLQKTVDELQELRITNVQLEEQIKFLILQKSIASQSQSQLQEVIRGHQLTIQKLQGMNEQTKKVVIDLNKLMKSKLAEIESLQMSNLMFRKQKLEWIKKEEEYRKKIAEIRASKKLISSQSSFLSRTTRKSYRNQTFTYNHAKNDKIVAHSMVLTTDAQNTLAGNAASFVNGVKSKTMVEAGCVKTKSVEFCITAQEMPVMPVLIQIRREDFYHKIQNQASQDAIRQVIQQKVKPDKQRYSQFIVKQQAYQKQELVESLQLQIPLESQEKNQPNYQNVEQGLLQTNFQTPDSKGQQQPQNQHSTKKQNQTLKLQSKQSHLQEQQVILSQKQKQQIQPQKQQKSQELTQQQDELDQATYQRQALGYIREQQQKQKLRQNGSDYQLEQAQCPIFKKISPINSRVLIKQDINTLRKISQDEQLKQLHELSQLKDLKEVSSPIQYHNHIEDQNTVNGINQLLDRLDVE